MSRKAPVAWMARVAWVVRVVWAAMVEPADTCSESPVSSAARARAATWRRHMPVCELAPPQLTAPRPSPSAALEHGRSTAVIAQVLTV